MIATPILINRPLVVTEMGTRLSAARPKWCSTSFPPTPSPLPSSRKTARPCSMRRASALSDVKVDLPAADLDHLRLPDLEALRRPFSTHKPRILILYGSVRQVSFSRLLAMEAKRLLEHFGAEVRVFDPSACRCRRCAVTIEGEELRDPRCRNCVTFEWSEGQVWVSPSVTAR